jgi:hypothetical protein
VQADAAAWLSEEQQNELFDTIWDIADIVLERQQAPKRPAPEQPAALTLAGFIPDDFRRSSTTTASTRPSSCYAQMQWLGLSDEQQYNLFDTIWDIADTISIQRRQDGYKEAIAEVRETMQQAQLAP